MGPSKPLLWQVLGPGLVTGAADDDPSGIATYSQAGAQFGFTLGWTLVLTFPLMVAIQEISARLDERLGVVLPVICASTPLLGYCTPLSSCYL